MQMEKRDLTSTLWHGYGFKTTPYGNGTINYKKQTLLKIIEVFRSRKIKKVKPATLCALSKGEIAHQLHFFYGIEFHPHEINYIPREEFIVLYNTLIEPEPNFKA
jgi:hypothetical protein